MPRQITMPIVNGTGGDSEHVEAEAISLPLRDARPATLALHADESLRLVDDIAPPIHVSSTYKYPNDPDQLRPFYGRDIDVCPSLPLPACSRSDGLFSSLMSLSIPESLLEIQHALKPYCRRC
jgi:hypothetical protein